VVAKKDDVREKYDVLKAIMLREGYDWETHEAKSEDGWYLTLFHIIKKTDAEEVPERDENRMPLLM